MSLLRRLLLSVSVALLAILLAALAFNLGAARTYLSEQLHVQSENAAASLALSLSQPGNQDPVVRELLLAALFDSGKFALVRLQAPDGHVLFQRESQPAAQPHAVPAWFQRYVPLPQAQTDMAVNNGWQQLGTVRVQVDNRYAQEVLWASSMKLVAFVVAAGLAWALFVSVLLRWFQRGLREEVAAQVLQIGQSVTEPPPARGMAQVAELQSVNAAIQSAHVRVQQQTAVQEQRIEGLELETHSDPVTGLPNRKYFVQALDNALPNATEEDKQGLVLLCRLRDLQRMNSTTQRQQVDAWLRDVAVQMHQLLEYYPEVPAQWARLNGSDFALLLLPTDGYQAMRLVQQARTMLKALNVSLGPEQWSRWVFALAPYSHQDSTAQIMVRLDQGLMQAESHGRDTVETVPAHAELLEQSNWTQVLRQALQEPQCLSLAVERRGYASASHTAWQYEASLQARTASGGVLRAAQLWPAVVRTGLSAAYDLRAVAMGLHWLQQHPQASLLSVRVAVASLADERWIEQLQQVLQQAPAVLSRLVLELDGYAVVHHPGAAMELAAMAQQLGVGIGLRSVERSLQGLLHMQALRPSYVKVSGHFAEQTVYNMGAAALLDAMLEAAQSVQAQVLVVDPVSAAVAQGLQQRGAACLVSDSGD